MNRKLVFVLIDGLPYRAAVTIMGSMQHLVKTNAACFYKVRSEWPSLSKPLYEVLFTGTQACVNGVLSNIPVRRSNQKSVFEISVSAGLKTAAAAYYWISELYNASPFDRLKDREQVRPAANIQFGRFYFDDFYPDSHVFADAEALRASVDPDFLLIHPMGVDTTGHRYGTGSREFYGKVQEIDSILSFFIPLWLSAGADIIVTADHGMTDQGTHGGTTDNECLVPLWALGGRFDAKRKHEDEIPQVGIAPTICRVLGIDRSKEMIDYAFPGLSAE